MYRKKACGVVLLNIIGFSFVLLVLLYGWRIPGMIGQGQHPSVMILIIIAFHSLYEIKDDILRRIATVGVFSYAIIQLISRPYYILKWFNEEERNAVVNSIGRTWHYIEGFDLPKFISAHYFVDTKFEILLLLFVILLFISVIFLLVFWPNRSVFSKMSEL